MNEEHDRENLPGTPPLSPGERPNEFGRMRGEVQHRGALVLAVPPNAPPAPVGIAPPDPRNVVSNFDTRPIGAYDFSNTQQEQMGPGESEQPAVFQYDVPDGFTAVLRRIRIEWTPPAAVNLTSPIAFVLVASLLRSGGIIPNNDVRFFGDLTSYEWPTHQVFGFWESLGLRLAPTGWAIPNNALDSVSVSVTFMGTLIPTKSRPPEVEIASDPMIVRDYDKMTSEQPTTGAAGE